MRYYYSLVILLSIVNNLCTAQEGENQKVHNLRLSIPITEFCDGTRRFFITDEFASGKNFYAAVGGEYMYSPNDKSDHGLVVSLELFYQGFHELKLFEIYRRRHVSCAIGYPTILNRTRNSITLFQPSLIGRFGGETEYAKDGTFYYSNFKHYRDIGISTSVSWQRSLSKRCFGGLDIGYTYFFYSSTKLRKGFFEFSNYNVSNHLFQVKFSIGMKLAR